MTRLREPKPRTAAAFIFVAPILAVLLDFVLLSVLNPVPPGGCTPGDGLCHCAQSFGCNAGWGLVVALVIVAHYWYVLIAWAAVVVIGLNGYKRFQAKRQDVS
jgi:hypothetical protein